METGIATCQERPAQLQMQGPVEAGKREAGREERGKAPPADSTVCVCHGGWAWQKAPSGATARGLARRPFQG